MRHPGPVRAVLAFAATYAIVGGNDNDGLPAFDIDPHTGLITLHSYHNFERSPRFYSLNLSITDTGHTGPAPITVYTIVEATLLDTNEPPLFGANVSDVAYAYGKVEDVNARLCCCLCVGVLTRSTP